MDKSMVQTIIEDDRTGVGVETLRRAMADQLFYMRGRYPGNASKHDYYLSLAYVVRDRLVQRWINTVKSYRKRDNKVVCYLSAEYLMGPHLGNNLINMGLWDSVAKAVDEAGLNLQELLDEEEEPGLGNGGLGRLAACYMDSMATLEIPAIGYGIRYEYGIFDQEIRDGWQAEITDKWLRFGNPWEFPRPDRAVEVKFGGHTEPYVDEQGRYRVRWIPERTVLGVPYDTPVPGYGVNTANSLRLWKAEATESFNLQAFNQGDYAASVVERNISENISKVLYPNDDLMQGKQLRLEQQYFFVSSSLQDAIRIHLREGDSIKNLHEKFAMQLNDTHPSVAIAELMRLLIDVYDVEWDEAWQITEQTFAYTNHTLLPEALERWQLSLFGSLLPRTLEIIFEINRRFLDRVAKKFPGDNALLQRLSLIDESGERFVRMAHLACVGSHAINGVARLHTELLEADVLKDFYKIFPEKFSNKTNGVTPRRWMVLSNPRMTRLITDKIGDSWIRDLDQLKRLEAHKSDSGFVSAWRKMKLDLKTDLANYIFINHGIKVDPSSLFDVQVKRIHEYKRQHLNVLHIIHLYKQLQDNRHREIVPRTFIFGGKAAPGYYIAKLMIKLINSVADVVNSDPKTRDLLKVVFLPDFNVRYGQRVYPASDLSEQISTAGKEASGTGNMKFALNGALTIGTLDGANIEMREEVGPDNFFLFGLTAQEVQQKKAEGYRPIDVYNSNEELRDVINLISSGHFSAGVDLFKPLVDSLLQRDDFMLLADFQSYIDCQKKVGAVYADPSRWAEMSILNVARMGKFSSDRAIREYCRDIWQTEPVSIELQEYCQATAGLSVPRAGK
ncbi:MAG TPA: glycogen/starch/alpha-glucan phosphorylase [Oculatellaceae cyanobacterium]